MDVKSATSSIGAYRAQTTAQQSQQSPQAEQSPTTQQLENRQPRPEERVDQKEQAPRPVLNAEGQKTGTVINVSA